MDMKAIGERIQSHRKLQALTQEELAVKSHVSTMSIRRYESGERMATKEVLASIAEALGVSLNYLLGYETEKVILPGRLKIVTLDDPDLNNTVYTIEATDQEAFQYGTEIIAAAGLGIASLTPESRILLALGKLNPTGQTVAVERVEELTKIEDYTKK